MVQCGGKEELEQMILPDVGEFGRRVNDARLNAADDGVQLASGVTVGSVRDFAPEHYLPRSGTVNTAMAVPASRRRSALLRTPSSAALSALAKIPSSGGIAISNSAHCVVVL